MRSFWWRSRATIFFLDPHCEKNVDFKRGVNPSVGSPWAPFGRPWGALGLPWGAAGPLLGALGHPLGALGLPLGALGVSLGSLGVPLGLFSAPLGVLGIPGAALGGPWGRLWAAFWILSKFGTTFRVNVAKHTRRRTGSSLPEFSSGSSGNGVVPRRSGP